MLNAELKDLDVLSTIDRIGQVDFQAFLNEAGQFMRQEIQEHATQGMGPDGPWVPNTGRYAEWKAKKYGTPPLTLTGELMQHISVYLVAGPAVDVGISDGIHQKIPRPFPFRAWEEPRDYASIAEGQETGTRSKGKPRQIFGINETEIQQVFNLFCDAVERIL